jgi:hypothetical protein
MHIFNYCHDLFQTCSNDPSRARHPLWTLSHSPHRPYYPTRAPPHAPQAQTDILYHPSIYLATACSSLPLPSHFPLTPPPHPPRPQEPSPCSVAEEEERNLDLLCKEEEESATDLDPLLPILLYTLTLRSFANLILPLLWI